MDASRLWRVGELELLVTTVWFWVRDDSLGCSAGTLPSFAEELVSLPQPIPEELSFVATAGSKVRGAAPLSTRGSGAELCPALDAGAGEHVVRVEAVSLRWVQIFSLSLAFVPILAGHTWARSSA
jgi:hypothetical protein